LKSTYQYKRQLKPFGLLLQRIYTPLYLLFNH
jgi:hypothetical protein